MLDRWENEGGRIATDTASEDINRLTKEKDRAKKLSSPRNKSMVGGIASSKKKHKRNGK
jgi:hypothetical protein